LHKGLPEIELRYLKIIGKRKHFPGNPRILVAILNSRTEERIDDGLRQVVDVVLRLAWQEELNVQ
jgi:hypothetical protein